MPAHLPKHDLPLMVSRPTSPKLALSDFNADEVLDAARASLQRELRRWEEPTQNVPAFQPAPGVGPGSAAPSVPDGNRLSRARVQNIVAPDPADLRPRSTPVGEYGRSRLDALVTKVRQFAQDYDALQRSRPQNPSSAFLKAMADAERVLDEFEAAGKTADAFRALQRQEQVKVSLINGVARVYTRLKDGLLDPPGSRRELCALVAELGLEPAEDVLYELDVDVEFIDDVLEEGNDCKTIKKRGAAETAAYTCREALDAARMAAPHGVRKLLKGKTCETHAFAAASVFGSPPIASRSRFGLRDTVTLSGRSAKP